MALLGAFVTAGENLVAGNFALSEGIEIGGL